MYLGVAIDQPLRGEWTALMHASSMGHPNIVEYLLKAGSDPNCHKGNYISVIPRGLQTMYQHLLETLKNRLKIKMTKFFLILSRFLYVFSEGNG